MPIAIIHSRALNALQAPRVIVETHLSNGLPAFNLVGLPEAAVKESKDRVRSAILNSQFEFPARRITVNLAPADLPKEGGRFDLAIALGILVASGQVPEDMLDEYEFIGELALTGDLRPVRGALNACISSKEAERTIILPQANGPEAELACPEAHLVANNLLQVCAHLRKLTSIEPFIPASPQPTHKPISNTKDMKEIRGQAQAKRALEIAAAGKHNLLYIGPPGCGKSMLAQRLPGILPNPSKKEILELLSVKAVTQAELEVEKHLSRPFRSPHHSSSLAALCGGGNPPKPGEISLAHHGVLFLDELPEFQRSAIESLREPLETGEIHISRANAQACFPAQFQLIAAMNPCPCGYHGADTQQCRCSAAQIDRYSHKISGPLLDRIDLQLHLQATPLSLLTRSDAPEETPSATIRQRVTQAHQRQLTRQGHSNNLLQGKMLIQHCQFTDAAETQLNKIIDHLKISARALERTLRVARTIADLSQSQAVDTPHLSEALSYRLSNP